MGFLSLQSMHGYDLHRQLRANLREVWRISLSQVYNILKRLEKEGLVSAEFQLQEKHPARACFSLTENGRAVFNEWLLAPTPGSAHALRVEFLTRMYFAGLTSESLPLRLVQEQVATSRRDIQRLQKRYDEIPPDQVYNRLGVELRIRQMRAILAWIEDNLKATIEGGD
jgi:PadR family transcriptional regulator AphA